jgi:hypothetical protein
LLEKDEHPIQNSLEFYQKQLCELVSKYDLSFEDFSINSFFEQMIISLPFDEGNIWIQYVKYYLRKRDLENSK